MSDNYTKLIGCPLFSGVVNIEELLKGVPFQVKSLQKGEVLVSANEPCNFLFIVAHGSVRGEMLDYSGKIVKIEDIPAPRPLAIAFLFGPENKFPVDIIANEDCQFFVFSKEAVLQLMQMSREFLRNYLNTVSARAQFLSKKIRFLSFQNIKGKFAHYILSQKSPSINIVKLSKSQQELADLFGVTRPALSRAIRELHNDGIIVAKGKEITIHNHGKLKAFLKN